MHALPKLPASAITTASLGGFAAPDTFTVLGPADQDAVPKSVRPASLRRTLRSRNRNHIASGIGAAMIGWVRAARAIGCAMLCYVTLGNVPKTK